MPRYFQDVPNEQGNPQTDIARCLMPISIASPRLSRAISKVLAENLCCRWPPKVWKSLDSHTNDVPATYYDGSFHGGTSGKGGVPPMRQSSSNAWQKRTKYRVPNHSLGIPKSAPIVSLLYQGNPPMGQAPSSCAWDNPTKYYGVPGYGFGIPMSTPMTRRVPPTGHASSYAWSIPAECTVPSCCFDIPDASFGVRSFGYCILDNGFRVYGNPPIMSGVNNFEKETVHLVGYHHKSFLTEKKNLGILMRVINA